MHRGGEPTICQDITLDPAPGPFFFFFRNTAVRALHARPAYRKSALLSVPDSRERHFHTLECKQRPAKISISRAAMKISHFGCAIFTVLLTALLWGVTSGQEEAVSQPEGFWANTTGVITACGSFPPGEVDISAGALTFLKPITCESPKVRDLVCEIRSKPAIFLRPACLIYISIGQVKQEK